MQGRPRKPREPNRPGFGGFLERFRDAKGIITFALAADAGLSPQTISTIETRETASPRLETVTRIAKALGMPASKFIALFEADEAKQRAKKNLRRG